MKRVEQRHQRRARRCKGSRKRILGSPQRPRLAVFRSIKHIYAQVIDDLSGRTLVAVSSKGSKGNCDAATVVGKDLAEKAQKAGIQTVVFDRRGYKYHGRVKALAESAREAGLQF